MSNALRANPQDLREQYEKQLKDLQEAYGEAMLGLRARRKVAAPAGRGREVTEMIRQGLQDEGYAVWISHAAGSVPRCTVYYKPTMKPPTMQERFAAPIKQTIEEYPSFGYRAVVVTH